MSLCENKSVFLAWGPGDFEPITGDYCVTKDQVCNGKVDCADGSDEKDCESYVCPANRLVVTLI